MEQKEKEEDDKEENLHDSHLNLGFSLLLG
jgi:hypothetical protein